MIVLIRDYEHWRAVARQLIVDEVSPSEVRLHEDDGRPLLFAADDLTKSGTSTNSSTKPAFKVPREFLLLSQEVSYHRDPDRWDLLFRSLWRIKNEQPHLLEITTDPDVHRLRTMEKQVRRDAHKMKAFVRFRRVVREEVEFFIAWHRPDHRIVRKVAPFFSRRFKGMNWTIITPDETVTWDQAALQYGPGAPKSEAPTSDELESLWRTYYASIFNPARVKIKAMKNEMPVRYWETMPETELIPELLASASDRVNEMIQKHEGYSASVEAIVDQHEREQGQPIQSIEALSSLAKSCTACELHCQATQTVFGEGPETAQLVIVGEQPGDEEDLAGRPFVGPAGQVLDEVFAAANIDRRNVYLTNTVKHFKHVVTRDMRGKRRLHKRPNASEIRVCKPWVQVEWMLLPQAAVMVCLGSTAAQAFINPGFKIQSQRGEFFESSLCSNTIATWHPSAILRTPDSETKARKLQEMVADLKLAAQQANLS